MKQGEILKEFKDDFTDVRFDYGRVQEQTSILDIIKIPERRLNLKVSCFLFVSMRKFTCLFYFSITNNVYLDKLNICLKNKVHIIFI